MCEHVPGCVCSLRGLDLLVDRQLVDEHRLEAGFMNCCVHFAHNLLALLREHVRALKRDEVERRRPLVGRHDGLWVYARGAVNTVLREAEVTGQKEPQPLKALQAILGKTVARATYGANTPYPYRLHS